jgi:uncharacterized protein with HEPN domain
MSNHLLQRINYHYETSSRIAHDYFGIDFATLESTVRHDLDQLEIVIRQILADEGTTWQFRSFADLTNATY